MQKYPFIPARNISFICSKIVYKDFLMKPNVRRFFSKMFDVKVIKGCVVKNFKPQTLDVVRYCTFY